MQETITYNYKNYSLDIPKSCYFPSDDTFLLLNTLEKEVNKIYENVLEVGFGSGVISLFLYDYANSLDCFDINPDAIDYFNNIKKKYDFKKIKILQSNLFEKANKQYDLIVFNPPYVPSEKINKKDIQSLATDGGKNGCEVINKFLEKLYTYLKDDGVCYLLVSSLNNININKLLTKNKLLSETVSSKKLFFEELLVLKIKKE